MDYYLLHNFYPNQYEQFNGFTINFNESTAYFKLDESVKIFDFEFFKSMNNLFIGSVEICKVLTQYNPTIQLIKCEGFFANHQPVAKSYFIINYSQAVDVMDYEQSEYSGKSLALTRLQRGESPQLIRTVKKLIVRKNFESSLHYFFLKSTLISQPIISQILFNELLTLNLKISVEKIS